MYTPKTFSIPELEGMSKQTIDEHLGLYAGYVKHVNLIHEKITAFMSEPEQNAYPIAEMRRRLGFEFGGMKNHEAYFAQLEGGRTPCPAGKFKDMVDSQFGSLENFITHLKQVTKTRGVGWVMVYVDQSIDTLVTTWVDEQQLGQLADVDIVFGIDMWEHSYMLDYPPSKKMEYVDAFFKNINWEVVAARV